MKKLIVVLLIVVLAALGGYTFYWNKRADEVKTVITDAITSTNNWAKAYTGNEQSIKYESVKTSGWPFHVNVTLVKPVIVIPVHNIAKLVGDAEKSSAGNDIMGEKEPKLKVDQATTWTETYSGEATVFSTNLFATELSITHEGEQRSVSTFNGVESNPVVFKASTPYSCSLRVNRNEGSSTLFDVKSVFKDGADFMQRFREVSCTARGINSVDGKTGEVLATTESANISYSMDVSNKAATTGHLALSIVNQKASKGQDKVFTNYVSMFYRQFLGREVDMALLGIPMSELGNNTVDVDVSFSGPTDPALLISKDMVLAASVNKFNIQNDLMKVDFETHLKSNPAQDAQQRDSAFVLRSTANYSERFDTLKLQEIQKIVEGILKDDGDQEMKALRDEVSAKLKIEEVRQAIDELWPRFHPNGNITLAIDVAAKTANPPLSPEGELTVSNLDIVTALDGIKISGKGVSKGAVPSGEAKITCLSCEGLLTRSYAYLKLIDKWMAKIDETYTAPVSEELFAGVKKFLKELSVPAKDASGKDVATDWLYHIKMTGEGEPTLNDKPAMKVMESFGQNVAPFLPNGEAKPSGEEPAESAPEEGKEPSSQYEPQGEDQKPTN